MTFSIPIIGPLGYNNLLNSVQKNAPADNTAMYPADLFSPGVEAHIIFFIRESVAYNAKVEKTIALYLPPDISVNYGTSWESLTMTIEQYEDSLTGLVSGGIDLFTGSAKEKMSAAQSALLTLGGLISHGIDIIPGMTANDQYQKITGTTVNPHMAQMFQGVNFRTFRFKFQLIARSKEESTEIQKIIKWLKLAQHPGRLNENSRYWTYPNNFDIYLATPENTMFNIARCVLTDMAIEYGTGGIQSFFNETGAPVDISVTLSFQELELLTKERIEQGY